MNWGYRVLGNLGYIIPKVIFLKEKSRLDLTFEMTFEITFLIFKTHFGTLFCMKIKLKKSQKFKSKP
jgi:hypothetical protein